MGIIEWYCVSIPSNDIHDLPITEGCMTISCTRFFPNDFALLIIEDDLWDVKLRILLLLLLPQLVQSVVNTLRDRWVTPLNCGKIDGSYLRHKLFFSQKKLPILFLLNHTHLLGLLIGVHIQRVELTFVLTCKWCLSHSGNT